MAVTRVIKGVHIVPMGMANAYLIEGDDGLTLIDAGYPGKEAAVFGAIRGLGRSPVELKHLILTHGHPDHIGSAAAIVRETGARTYMHPLDIPIAGSGGPFRPLIAAQVCCDGCCAGCFTIPTSGLSHLPSTRLSRLGRYCPSLAASKSYTLLGIARDKSRSCVTVTASIGHPLLGCTSLEEIPEGMAPRLVFKLKPECHRKQNDCENVMGLSRLRQGTTAVAPTHHHDDPISRHIASTRGDLLSWLRPENVVLTGPRLSEAEDIKSWIEAIVTKWEKEHGPIPKRELLPHEIG
jgi:Metallo-beta-lactamase superfamily